MGFGKDKRGVIIRDHSLETVSLASLSSGVVQKFGSVAVTEDFRLLKAEVFANVHALGVDEAVIIGIADNELSVAEIAEALQANGPLDRNDRLLEEKATRPVWIMGILGPVNGTEGDTVVKELHHKRAWSFSNDEGFTLFAYNPTANAISATIGFHATYFGVWLS